MKLFILTTVTLVSNAVAFPHMDALTGPIAAHAHAHAHAKSAKRQIDATSPQGAGALPLVPPPFDANSQYVSNKGAHAFHPPGTGDARGQCPGLNAMANHNYLPHNGRASITQFIDACQRVFGMGLDLATFLATYGAVVDGDGTSWSIEGGPHVGIGGSHSNYETDSSPLKGDLYQYGDLSKLVLSQYKELYNMQPDSGTANYNLEVLRDFRGSRFQESIDKNPNYFYGPFAGMAVSQAAFTFIYRFMANKSAEYPEGILNKEVLKSFMSITGPDDNPVWTKGYERIPDNWYKRNTANAYTIPYFETDILYFSAKYPEINLVGCNQGRVNSFNEISIETISDGAYTAQQVAAHPLCFATQFAATQLPGVTGLGGTLLASLLRTLDSVSSKLGCNPISSVNTTALSVCPGFSLYGGPKGPVAPGAIQS